MRVLLPLFTATLLALPSYAQAFIVQQWQGGNAGNNGLTGALAAINSRAPNITATVNTIDFSDAPGYSGSVAGSVVWPLGNSLDRHSALNNDFAARVTGQFYVATAGNYTFRTYNDDGVRLRINGNTIINDNSYHAATFFTSGNVYLPVGLSSLEVIFFEGGGEGILEVAYRGPGFNNYILVPSATAAGNRIPEPSGLVLSALGLITWAMVSRRRHAQAHPIRAQA